MPFEQEECKEAAFETKTKKSNNDCDNRSCIIAESPLMQKILKDVNTIAKSSSSVFISGESGTGKEVIAHAIHRSSHRAGQAFIKVNCAAIPISLLESEFFGHEKGAFTGAIQRRIGRFELADKGTLLLDEKIENAIKEHDMIAASVLSGNRNFEARIHGSVKANFLMSPPLVVAYALAGRVDIDLTTEPIGKNKAGKPVYLKDIWPSSEEIEQEIQRGLKPEMFKNRYAHIQDDNPIWKDIVVKKGAQYAWDPKSTYIQNPPFFENFSMDIPKRKELKDMRALALFGDSITTDHISPAGAFKPDSSAGKYLLSLGVKPEDFNSYGSRRGNHHIMMRGTFANVRIRNKMADGKEGGFTKFMPDGTVMPIFDACQKYEERHVPLIVFAGKDYGMGSSRDWAAKGTALLGVRVVVAQSFERIHRSNLVGMGVLPLQFKEGQNSETAHITGTETFSITGLEKNLHPHQEVTLEIHRAKDQTDRIALLARLDTPIDIDYYLHGGILPYVLRQLLSRMK